MIGREKSKPLKHKTVVIHFIAVFFLFLTAKGAKFFNLDCVGKRKVRKALSTQSFANFVQYMAQFIKKPCALCG
ncbi:hypothetical protein CFS9_31930 [Flavobacterium sp. CFS9]|uniref:Transposase n=1 Tax=Flavobacterium sp. CFS9 TaxID=3143118 RepID=A0AAT9H4W9_9FLAO